MDAADTTRSAPTPSPFREAIFENTATAPGDVLLVTIPEFSADQPFGDPDGVVWSPMGGQLPAAGDRALVAESSDGTWWVIQWWSSTQSAGVSQSSVDALDTRLDAIEAKQTVEGIVDTTGSGSIVEGSGFTLTTRHGTGDVTLTFDTPFSDVPAVAVSASQALSFRMAGPSAVTASTVRVAIGIHNGTAGDGEFHFIATGPA